MKKQQKVLHVCLETVTTQVTIEYISIIFIESIDSDFPFFVIFTSKRVLL